MGTQMTVPLKPLEHHGRMVHRGASGGSKLRGMNLSETAEELFSSQAGTPLVIRSEKKEEKKELFNQSFASQPNSDLISRQEKLWSENESTTGHAEMI